MEYKGYKIFVEELRKGSRDWSEDACIYTVPELGIEDECETDEAEYYASKDIDNILIKTSC